MKLNMVMAALIALASATNTGATDSIFLNGFENASSVCPAPISSTRQNQVYVKYGTKPGLFMANTHDQVFNVSGTTYPIQPFPQTGNRAVSFAVSTGQYVALPFQVGASMSARSFGYWGAFDTNYLGSPSFPANIKYSLSQCPGDFTVSAACQNHWNGADGNYLTWRAPEVPDPTGAACPLERGKTYYLNIFVEGCATGNCGVSISYVRQGL